MRREGLKQEIVVEARGRIGVGVVAGLHDVAIVVSRRREFADRSKGM
jgi:hypothetical protein